MWVLGRLDYGFVLFLIGTYLVMMSESEDSDLIPAATVLLLRDAGPELEVLMVRRNSKIAFGGMWVFPGGRVDDDEMIEGQPLESARRAAVREVEEETGLVVSADDLVDWSQWIPPQASSMVTKGPRRRFSTWFFAVEAPAGEVMIDHGEIHDDAWLSPAAAHKQHLAGDIELAPPTWITLWQLAQHSTVEGALTWARASTSRLFQTRAIAKDPITLVWHGDAAYDTRDPATPGERNRLRLLPDGWQYDCDS